jgi:hypothetical protein
MAVYGTRYDGDPAAWLCWCGHMNEGLRLFCKMCGTLKTRR